jgi:hypothetical protein
MVSIAYRLCVSLSCCRQYGRVRRATHSEPCAAIAKVLAAADHGAGAAVPALRFLRRALDVPAAAGYSLV